MFDQLPVQVQNSLLKDYLFVNFVQIFQKSYFRIPKTTHDFRIFSIVKYTKLLYNWEDQIFRDVLIQVIRVLEPRNVKAGTIIYNVLEEADELYFIERGSIDIGF